MSVASPARGATRIPVAFTLNGRGVQAQVGALESLLDLLRLQFNITSARVGCSEGSCGVCTVLIDGEARRGCLTPAFAAEGRDVVTLEGIGTTNALHPLQKSFHEHFASQCGFCTPGHILTAKALLDRDPAPSREDIVAAISGNLCRCTGYQSIVDAIAAVADSGGQS